jgi:hypothetical protein
MDENSPFPQLGNPTDRSYDMTNLVIPSDDAATEPSQVGQELGPASVLLRRRLPPAVPHDRSREPETVM